MDQHADEIVGGVAASFGDGSHREIGELDVDETTRHVLSGGMEQLLRPVPVGAPFLSVPCSCRCLFLSVPCAILAE
ncbi:MAG: hypothetical protein WBQ44_17260 [Rhodococcus sp. (in: high G+C Gram-positive bacteria)]